jgi:NitT/TauT family transport system substrate-binding protein
VKRHSLLLGMSALLAARRASAAEQTLQTLRLMGVATDTAGALLYAKDLGLFQKYGLNADVELPNSTSLAVSAVIGGAVDIAYTNVISIEQAYRKGTPIVIVCPANLNVPERPTSFLLVAKTSPIKTARDLEGKIIGTQPLKSLGDNAVNAWMAARGADPSRVKWLEIPFVACAEALARGRIDAAVVVEPFGTQARETTRNLGRPFDAVAKYFYGAAYIASKTWASAHPDAVMRFVGAIAEASRWANKNPQLSATILEKYSGVDAETVAGMTRVVLADRMDPADLQATIDFAAKYGIIDGRFPARDLIFQPPSPWRNII